MQQNRAYHVPGCGYVFTHRPVQGELITVMRQDWSDDAEVTTVGFDYNDPEAKAGVVVITTREVHGATNQFRTRWNKWS